MGQSTDALLAFGVDLGEENDFPWRDDEDIEHWWAKQHGWVRLDLPYNEETKFQYHQSWEERAAVCKRFPLPVEEVRHCSSEYPMYILAVPGTRVRAGRGYAEKGVRTREVNPQAFLDFCKKYNIALPAEPDWLLFSNWS